MVTFEYFFVRHIYIPLYSRPVWTSTWAICSREPALTGGLDPMISWGPLQPLHFCDPVTHTCTLCSPSPEATRLHCTRPSWDFWPGRAVACCHSISLICPCLPVSTNIALCRSSTARLAPLSTLTGKMCHHLMSAQDFAEPSTEVCICKHLFIFLSKLLTRCNPTSVNVFS